GSTGWGGQGADGALRIGRGAAGRARPGGGDDRIAAPPATELDRLFREEHGRVLASLIGVLGDFDLAEDALQDAVAEALERWPRDGMPANPVAWLVTVARNRAVDRIRRERNLEQKAELLGRLDSIDRIETGAEMDEETRIPDESLSLFFVCCPPSIALEYRLVITLRFLSSHYTAEFTKAVRDVVA